MMVAAVFKIIVVENSVNIFDRLSSINEPIFYYDFISTYKSTYGYKLESPSPIQKLFIKKT